MSVFPSLLLPFSLVVVSKHFGPNQALTQAWMQNQQRYLAFAMFSDEIQSDSGHPFLNSCQERYKRAGTPAWNEMGIYSLALSKMYGLKSVD